MAANRFPYLSDTPTVQQFLGQVGGSANVWQPADSSLTRPNNTTAYSANQAIGSSTVVQFKFSNFFRMKGGTGLLSGMRLIANVASIATSNMGSIRAHLYNASPAGALAVATADQTNFETLFADDGFKVGTVDFTTWNIGSTGSDTIESYGVPAVSPLPVIGAVQTASDLYCVLMAISAFTPAANQVILPYVAAVLD